MINEVGAILVVYIVGFGGSQHVSLDVTHLDSIAQCELAKNNVAETLQRFGRGKGENWKPTEVNYVADCYESPNMIGPMMKDAVRDAMGTNGGDYSNGFPTEPSYTPPPQKVDPEPVYKTHKRWDK